MQMNVFTVIQHSDDLANDVALWYEANVARVSRVVGVNGFQPVVVCFGASIQSRNQQWTFLRTDGIARNGFAAGDIQSCDGIAGNGKGDDVATLYWAAHQSAVG